MLLWNLIGIEPILIVVLTIIDVLSQSTLAQQTNF